MFVCWQREKYLIKVSVVHFAFHVPSALSSLAVYWTGCFPHFNQSPLKNSKQKVYLRKRRFVAVFFPKYSWLVCATFAFHMLNALKRGNQMFPLKPVWCLWRERILDTFQIFFIFEQGIASFISLAPVAGICVAISQQIKRLMSKPEEFDAIIENLSSKPQARVVVMFVDEDNTR